MSISNKKAYFNYEMLTEFTAGIMLSGPEVKAIRLSKASFVDSYCKVIENEIYVTKLHIDQKDVEAEVKTRDRKLLLTKKEIKNIQKSIKEKGLSVVPLKLFINQSGLIKINIALARGKKNYDKRASLKEKDLKREQKDG